jgi:hypothetical protein
MSVTKLGLIGDIGATNARFALVGPEGETTAARAYALDDYPSLPEAIGAYLEQESPPAKPDQAVLAVASPITGDQVTFTNHPWTFSIEAVRTRRRLHRGRHCPKTEFLSSRNPASASGSIQRPAPMVCRRDPDLHHHAAPSRLVWEPRRCWNVRKGMYIDARTELFPQMQEA